VSVGLASVFRSAVDRAGLAFEVDCPPLPERVYLDRGMWEKVVLNLLSNALKFTFDGSIRVAVRAGGGQAVVTVADTGIGIPQQEMPRLFERFHRIENTRSRSNEGSGIGLALVQELIQLHGDGIRTPPVHEQIVSGSGTGPSAQTGRAMPPHPHSPRSRTGHDHAQDRRAGPDHHSHHISLADPETNGRVPSRRATTAFPVGAHHGPFGENYPVRAVTTLP
jgi:Histidine kinase-, DNA gyrase B-, and HSP90-like ATPase